MGNVFFFFPKSLTDDLIELSYFPWNKIPSASLASNVNNCPGLPRDSFSLSVVFVSQLSQQRDPLGTNQESSRMDSLLLGDMSFKL
eukprot:97453-Amphidinium_carterae.1